MTPSPNHSFSAASPFPLPFACVNSNTMGKETRYSGKRAAQGCSLSIAIIVVSTLLLSLVLNKWLGLTYSGTQKTIELIVWLLAVLAGGYFAANLGKTVGWSNSLLVGCFAFAFILIRGWNRIELTGGLGYPFESWRLIAACLLTIPAAILGGVLWVRTRRQDEQSTSSTLGSEPTTGEQSDATERR